MVARKYVGKGIFIKVFRSIYKQFGSDFNNFWKNPWRSQFSASSDMIQNVGSHSKHVGPFDTHNELLLVGKW